jgi:hypothetical protein
MPGWKQARAAFIIRDDDAFVVFVFFFVSHCHRPMPSDHKTSHLLYFAFPLPIHASGGETLPSVRRAAVGVFLREVVTTWGVASFLALFKSVL